MFAVTIPATFLAKVRQCASGHPFRSGSGRASLLTGEATQCRYGVLLRASLPPAMVFPPGTGEKLEDARRARAGETVVPEFEKDAFHCMFCNVFASQT